MQILGPSASGTIQRVKKKTYIQRPLTADIAKSIGLDQYYTPVEEMSWYLFQTEDMPNTVEDYIDRKIARMEKLLATLNLYLDAELGIQSQEAGPMDEPVFIDQPDPFTTSFESDFSSAVEDDSSKET